MNDLKLVRISNITNIKAPPGHFLDFAGVLIGAGKHVVVDLTNIDQKAHPGSTLDRLQIWVAEGKARVVNASDGTPITMPEETYVTPGTRFNEVASSQLPPTDAEDFEEDFDPTLAKEAEMPAVEAYGAHAPDTQNVTTQQKGKVSLSGEEPNWDNSGTSPIPGSKPRYVDDSEKFSVRAPRSGGVGGIVGK